MGVSSGCLRGWRELIGDSLPERPSAAAHVGEAPSIRCRAAVTIILVTATILNTTMQSCSNYNNSICHACQQGLGACGASQSLPDRAAVVKDMLARLIKQHHCSA